MHFSTSMSWLFLTVLVCTGFVEGRQEYYVHPENQEHLCPDNSSCFDLAYFATSFVANGTENSSDLLSNVVINFFQGVYFLNESEAIVIRQAKNLTLQGPDTAGHVGFHETVRLSSVKITCLPSATAGFVFYKSEFIVIRGITFVGCAVSPVSSLARQLESILASFFNRPTASYTEHAILSFISVANLTLDRVSVVNGTEYGLLAFNAFDVVINDSSFSGSNWRNQCNESANSRTCYGGNAAFYFVALTGCPSQPYFVNITNSNFSFGMNSQHLSGGLRFLMLQGRSVRVDVTLNSVVAYNNIGDLGANLQYETSSLAAHSLTILNCTISNGNGNKIVPTRYSSSYGGGVYFMPGNIIYPDPNEVCNSIDGSGDIGINYCSWAETCHAVQPETLLHIENTVITGNSAMFGGGLFMNVLSPAGFLQKANIVNSIITNNTGIAGSGLFLEEFDYLDLHTNLEVGIENVTVSHNLPYPSFETDSEAGAFYIRSVDDIYIDGLVMSAHVTTGIIVYNSLVILSGSNNTISNNSGQYGGGLALYESYFFLYGKASISFVDNHASEKGGAIYVKKNDIDQFCSIQSEPDYTTDGGLMFFARNSAGKAGSVLYGENLDSCTPFVYDSRMLDNNFTLFDVDEDDRDGPSVFSSDPVKVCFCENDLPNCSRDSLNYSALPGEILLLPMVLIGYGDGISTGILSIIKVVADTDVNIGKLIELPPECSSQPYKVSLNTTELVTVTLRLKVVDSLYAKTNQDSMRFVEITVAPCPLGFELDDGDCQCSRSMTEAVPSSSVACDVGTEQLERKGDAWIGYDNSTQCIIAFADCPFDYCNSDAVTFTLAAPDAQCSFNRSGTLCGQCAEGLSLLLGSNRCSYCSNGYLALVLPFAVAGIALVVLLLALNLTVSVGAINGLIFYANIVKINETVFFPNGPVPFLSQFVAWLNLDLGIETCFFDGMNSYWKTWLQFVFPLYIWSIIVVIICACRYSARLSRFVGNNAVPVLATLFLLAYTKLFRLVVTILQMVTLTCSSSTDSRSSWKADPNVEYFSATHVFLFVSAVCVLVFITIPYTLILLFGQLLEKYLPRSKHMRPVIIKLKPFLDSYNGPYKDKLRFWTGLLLLLRLFIVLISIRADDNASITTIISMTSLLLSIGACCGGVYRKKYLTVLECWFLLNLSVLSALVDSSGADISVIVSLCLVFLSFVVIVVYQLMEVFKLKPEILEWFKRFKSVSHPSDVVSSVAEVDTKEPYRPHSSTVVDINDLCSDREAYFESLSTAL